MKKALSIFVASSILFAQCSTQKNTISLSKTKQAVVREDITFSYSDDQIANKESNLKTGWANRNDIQVLSINIINNSDEAIHGTQFCFINEGDTLEIVNNKIAAKKLKTKKFPTYIYLIPPALVVGVVYVAIMTLTYSKIDHDNDGFEDYPQLNAKKKKPKDELQGLNAIQKGLYTFNIAEKTLLPNQQLSGLIAFKSTKPIHTLDIKVRKLDYWTTEKQ
jgi:hypothetical protein